LKKRNITSIVSWISEYSILKKCQVLRNDFFANFPPLQRATSARCPSRSNNPFALLTGKRAASPQLPSASVGKIFPLGGRRQTGMQRPCVAYGEGLVNMLFLSGGKTSAYSYCAASPVLYQPYLPGPGNCQKGAIGRITFPAEADRLAETGRQTARRGFPAMLVMSARDGVVPQGCGFLQPTHGRCRWSLVSTGGTTGNG
jgi:hypothetical protein